MTTIEQLEKLAKIAPDVCQRNGDEFTIDDYTFFKHLDYGFMAYTRTGASFNGQPALDWLQCALQRAIESKKLLLQFEYDPDVGGWRGRFPAYNNNFTLFEKFTDVLFDALIKALEVEK